MVRVKNRYLLVHILYPDGSSYAQPNSTAVPNVVKFRAPTPEHVDVPILLKLLRETIIDIFGDYGAGVTAGGLAIKYFSPATSTFIVRCPRASVRIAWAALSFVTRIPSKGDHPPQTCVMRVVRVSGTIRKAEEALIERGRKDILGAKGEEGPDGGVDVLEGIFGKGNKTGAGLADSEEE